MAGRGRQSYGPRGLTAYLVEVQDRDGVTTVPEKFSYLVRKCIEDKVFSENRHHITLCRTDNASSEIQFGAASWEGLRKGLKSLNSTEVVGAENPITCLDKIVHAMVQQTKEDTYEDKKILFFADLSSYILDKDELEMLADKLVLNDIFISVVLPNKVTMNDLQMQNSKLLKQVLNGEKFEEISAVKSLNQAERQILNTQTKKPTRPSPWNCPLEITPNIIINVSGFVCTRKNKVGEMTRVLMKQVEPEIRTSSNQRQLPSTSSDSNLTAPSEAALERVDNQDKKVEVEVAKNVLAKEQAWVDNDGNTVEEEDIGKAYYFGEKLVQFNDLEREEGYKTGEKCFKLLLFCPPENINPAFLTGDGTTLFYPKKDDPRAEVMFRALLNAMINTNRIAVVRKVYLRDRKLSIGSLVPDFERQCLVFTELCFADDVSIPQLPLLIRREEIDNNENAETNEKEDLIDKLIKSKTLDSFSPSDGPVDPAVFALREQISRKILTDSVGSLELEATSDDNLSIYFRRMADDSNNVLLQIKSSFPLTQNKVEQERLAGQNVFRKRELEEPLQLEAADKKPKLEISNENEAEDVQELNNSDDIDDLLDEL